MALILLTGKTGSGKSYEAVTRVLGSLAEGRKVYTNIQMTVTDDNYNYYDELELKKLLEYIEKTFKSVENLDDKKAEIKKGIYFDSDFYIDEAHLVGFRDKKEAILNWLTLQRHFNQNIYVITQVASNIHRDYLMMFHTHIDMIPPNKRLSKNGMGYREFDAYKGERLRTNFFKPKTDVFEIYNSGNIEQGQSAEVKKIVAVFGGLGLLFVLLFSNLSSMFSTERSGQNYGENNNSAIAVYESLTNDQNITYDSVMCSTRSGCSFEGLRLTYDNFISQVIPIIDIKEKQLIARSSSETIYIITYLVKSN